MTSSFPHNSLATINRGVAEAGWRQFARLYLHSGVILGLGDGLVVSADGVSGVQVQVASGRAWVDGFFIRNDEPFVVPLQPADPADDRPDLIVVRYDPEGFAEDPTPSGTVEIVAKTGIPDPYGGVLPSVVQDPDGIWEVPLASVVVEAAAAQVPPGNVFDMRVFTTQVRDLSGTTAEREAAAGAVLEGTWWFDTDLGSAFRWNGSEWTDTLNVAGAVSIIENAVAGLIGEAEQARDDAQAAASLSEDAAILYAIALGG